MEGKIFVYGTLKEGGRFAEVYKDKFDPLRKGIRPAKIKGTLFNLGSFPGVKLEGDAEVKGEIHSFDEFDAILKIMDRIEGYRGPDNPDNLFNRETVEAELDDGSTEEAVIYTFARDANGAKIVEDGVWAIA